MGRSPADQLPEGVIAFTRNVKVPFLLLIYEIEDNAMEEQQILENKNEESEGNTEEKKGGVFGDVMEILESIMISVFAVLMIFTFIARPVTVDGRSMMPTLNDKDRLVMRTCLYTPKNGDIVIVDNEHSYTFLSGTNEIIEGQSLNKRLIKRVIAVGGQTVNIDFDSHEVYVDGELLTESYIKEPTILNSGAFDYPITIPEGYIFVMGDNRNNSTDSRDSHVGLVKESDVLGKAVMRFYPEFTILS